MGVYLDVGDSFARNKPNAGAVEGTASNDFPTLVGLSLRRAETGRRQYKRLPWLGLVFCGKSDSEAGVDRTERTRSLPSLGWVVLNRCQDHDHSW